MTIMVAGFLLGEIKNVLELIVVIVTPICDILKPLNCIL